jgi:hypothetical protein
MNTTAEMVRTIRIASLSEFASLSAPCRGSRKIGPASNAAASQVIDGAAASPSQFGGAANG